MFDLKICLNNSWVVDSQSTTKGEARLKGRDIIKHQHIKRLNNKSWFEIYDNGKMIYKASLSGYRNKFVIDFMGIKHI